MNTGKQLQGAGGNVAKAAIGSLLPINHHTLLTNHLALNPYQ
jgi:hypothetical protein